MKHWLKPALIFTAGLVAGGAAGWFTTRTVLNKKREEEIDSEIDKQVKESREWYHDAVKAFEKFQAKTDISETEVDTEDDNVEKVEVEEVSKPRSYTARMNQNKEDLMRRERTRYERTSNEYRERKRAIRDLREAEAQEEVDEALLSLNNDNPNNDIFIITPEQFGKERFDHNKLTLYWWPRNNLLTDEDGNILDIPDLLGMDWQGRIGEFEEHTVYVRNNQTDADYGVVEQEGSYHDYDFNVGDYIYDQS